MSVDVVISTSREAGTQVGRLRLHGYPGVEGSRAGEPPRHPLTPPACSNNVTGKTAGALSFLGRVSLHSNPTGHTTSSTHFTGLKLETQGVYVPCLRPQTY